MQATLNIAGQDIECPVIERWLTWQRQGLQATATGYGSKIPTCYCLVYGKRVYRIYCAIYSNSGTCHILVKGEKVVVSVGF